MADFPANSQLQNTFCFCAEGNCLVLEVWTQQIIRFRFAKQGNFERDFSYSVIQNRPQVQVVDFFQENDFYIIKTNILFIYIYKNLSFKIININNNLIYKTSQAFYETNEGVFLAAEAQENEYFYGLGDKPCHLNLRGKRFQNWNTDAFAYKSDTDPLYKSIPFYYGLHQAACYGIFLDNTRRTFFDFDSENKREVQMGAVGSELNFYFFFAPSLLEIASQYAWLTGVPELPPLWALGYHQSKWSYGSEGKVKAIAQKLRKLQIPCDVIHIDIDYMDGFRCFTWNEQTFPKPKRLLQYLEKNGFRAVLILDPGLKIDEQYVVYNEARERDFFCKNPDGSPAQGKVWPGECNFPDFTLPAVRDWWAGLYQNLVELGVHGFWNDMNEPALLDVPSKTMPDEVLHDYDGDLSDHRRAHNIYGMQMVRASYQGIKQFAPNKRPFLLTRAAYAGTQRYAAAWTGDNLATWEHLRIANTQCQRMSISGYSFVGTDIGGFADYPTGELYVRWVQLAIFHPFCRTHSAGDKGNQEPWVFGQPYLEIARKFLLLRYELLSYIYTVFWKYVTNGTPMLQPIAFFDQGDGQTHFRQDEFLLGDAMLICPVLEPASEVRNMYFPKGEWYYFFDNEKMVGGIEKSISTPLEEFPIFIKAGAVLCLRPAVQFAEQPTSELPIWKVYFKAGSEQSICYEDAGEAYDYAEGKYKNRSLELVGEEAVLQVTQAQKGAFAVAYSKIRLHFIGLPFVPKTICVNGQKVDNLDIIYKNNSQVIFAVEEDFQTVRLEV